MPTDCKYRVSAKALIKSNDGKLLFVKENGAGGFELPGGGIENGETIEQAFTREIHEELDVAVVSIASSPSFTWIINGEVVWLVFEVVIDSNDFQPDDGIETAGYYTLNELRHQNPSALGYCCTLYTDELQKYLLI